MNPHPSIAFVLALAVGASAQHAGHSSDPSAEVVAACLEAQQRVAALADQAEARLEAARQSNSPREMRAAVADLQAMLVEIRTRAEECAPLEPEGEPKTGN
jgi:hypothetical protein